MQDHFFCDAEFEYNEKFDKFLSDLGFTTFLLQRDGDKLVELEKKVGRSKALRIIYRYQLNEYDNIMAAINGIFKI